LTTCLITISLAGLSSFVIVQVAEPPSGICTVLQLAE
jgi:hypothetical protein